MKQSHPQLSVLMPVYNEVGTILDIIRRVLGEHAVAELIVVDDGSSDGTAQVLLAARREHEFLLAIHEENRGKGAAIQTALSLAKGDLVVIQDADLEYDPNDYANMLKAAAQGGARVVYGSRYLRHPDSPSWHTLMNRCLTLFFNLLSAQHLTDMETCYKMLPRECLLHIGIWSRGFGLEPEVSMKLATRNIRIREVPIRYRYRTRQEGKKIGVSDGVRAVAIILWYSLMR